ncbi:WhiB family transcriptional regulator [Streptomyces acidiscabies]|uniref:Transcriptional regulator WhiB n=1 Tax=Streptomyces acidiscabies TaxID=42234 RepID=A0AAP6BL13_9ACTN|nr:WhiB family transcriptional regulator [Streptomyces acidiscabies]MBZ3909400.1 WhiB family transcriptional regulator [Streptomyces acidiscabies]MDX2966630.1 WhiB family transcriptional regulator [Streptomyces acidiscabies]MDX3796600.1 WhiB family transcriptional regulator [Streptomyces acidiscabies]
MTAALHDLMTRTEGLSCRTDPEPFFSPNATDRQYAARQCHACPLLLACQHHALATGEQHGVWGGVDFEARAMGCGTERGYQIHIRRKESICPRCQSAHDEAVEANRRQLLAEAHRAGGTTRGYWMHRRLGEEACVKCKRAQARKSKERRERAHAGVVVLPSSDPLNGPQGPVQRLPLAA